MTSLIRLKYKIVSVAQHAECGAPEARQDSLLQPQFTINDSRRWQGSRAGPPLTVHRPADSDAHGKCSDGSRDQ